MNDVLMTKRSSIPVVPNVSFQNNTSMLPSLHLSRKKWENQPKIFCWLFPVLWPPDVKNWLIGKDPHAGKDWRQENKGMAEDEMVEYHHRLNRLEFEQTPGGQRSLVCYSPWDHKESNKTSWLNNNNNNIFKNIGYSIYFSSAPFPALD